MQHQWATVRPIVPAPRLILFDLDDTLCDYASARLVRLRKAFSVAFQSVNPPPTIDLEDLIAQSLAIHPHVTDHFVELLLRYGIKDPSVAETASTWYREHRFHSLALFADAVETLAAVRRLPTTKAIGMITNGPTEVQRAKIEMFDLMAMVDFILISEEFGAGKPDPAIFVEALRLGGALQHESIFIGDSPEYDIAGAKATGIRSIWVNRTGKPWAVELPPPDYEARDLEEVRALLGAGDTRP